MHFFLQEEIKGLSNVEKVLLDTADSVMDTKKKLEFGVQQIIFKVRAFSNFSCMFLNPNIFFPIWILIVLIYYIWETPRNKLKKHSVTKNCPDLSLFE